MKKLKGWQIALLIIFYPVGIIYLIYRICKKKEPEASAPSDKKQTRESIVFITEKGKVFHSAPDCPSGFCDQITEKEARKRGLTPCKKCCNPQFYKF